MDDAELTAIVAECARADPRTREGLTSVFALESKLKTEPEFSEPRMVVTGRGGYGWLPQIAAQKMISLVRSGRSANAAVAWLRKAPSITKGTGGLIKLLYGVKCTDSIQLTNDVVLLPFSKVPASEMLDWILREHSQANESLAVHGFTEAPTAALFRPGIVDPIFRNTSEDWTNRPPATWFDELDDAARLLVLVPKTIPLEAAHWIHYDDPDTALLGQFGLARQGSEIRPFITMTPVDVTATSMTGIVPSYYPLRKSDQDRINLAMNRMIRSRCQFVSGNRAIDLAIALEVLFMNADRDEHSYKISLRAARLLRKEAAERRRTFLEVRRLYDMRSSMVHTGNIKDQYNLGEDKASAHDIVEAVDVVCAEAIRAFLRLGGIPTDWRDIELS